jgi:hypothetical protein
VSEQNGWKKIEQPLGSDWVVEMTWTGGVTSQDGPSSVTIRPADPDHVAPGGLSSTVLRKVNFRAAAAQLRDLSGVATDFLARVKEEQTKGPRPIDMVREALAEGVTDDYLALLTAEYLGRVDAGQEKPVDRIAEELGRSLGTVKGHLWQARNRDLLLGGSAGRKGGAPSDKARQLAMDWSMKRRAPKSSG